MSIHNQPSTTACVEKYLGSSYDVVKKVADNLAALQELADISELNAVLADIVATVAVADATLAEIDSNLATKQDTLISGTNIKSINDVSILGSGNLSLSGISGVATADLVATQDHIEQLILMGV